MQMTFDMGSIKASTKEDDKAWVTVSNIKVFTRPISIGVGEFVLQVTMEQARAIYEDLRERFEEVKDV